MDDEEMIGKLYETTSFLGIERAQDYSHVLHELSRAKALSEGDTLLTVIVERAWCGEVSKYIAELENALLETSRLLEGERTAS